MEELNAASEKILILLASLACQAVSGLTETPVSTIPLEPTALPVRQVEPREQNPDEPVFILGVISDILEPVTEQDALGQVDAVLQAAIEALLK